MLKRLKEIKCPNKLLGIKRDRELISKLQNGDLDSFSPIYSRFYKPVLKYVLNQIKSTHVAEELAQDIFFKIYQFRGSYNPNFEPSTWIWTIARNTVYDYLRRSRASMGVIDNSQNSSDALELEIASTETAESIMIEELEKRKLIELMATLSSKQKEAIFLRLVKKFSYREISKSMNLSLSAVKSLINRGKTSLMKLNSETNSTQNLQIP
jgi:RNA polymerase sigma-70 factor (ECF subfamily)